MTEIQTTEQALDKHLIKMDRVVSLYLSGYQSREIAKKLDVSTQQVNAFLKEWRGLAQNNEAIKSRAVVALRNADKHYDQLVRRAHDALDDAEDDGRVGPRLAAIKTIADLEKVRIELMQKAGALEDMDLSNQIMETERKQQILMDILRTTVGSCDKCRPVVQQKLAEVTNEVVVIPADV